MARNYSLIQPAFFLVVALLLLNGCATTASDERPSAAVESAEAWFAAGEYAAAAQAFLELADESRRSRDHFRLRAAQSWREEGDLPAARRLAQQINRNKLGPSDNLHFDLLLAEFALADGDNTRTLNLLTLPDSSLPPNLRLRVFELRARALAANGDGFGSARQRMRINAMLPPAERDDNELEILVALASIDPHHLQRELAKLPGNDPLRPFVEITLRKAGLAAAQVLPQLSRQVGTLSRDSSDQTPEGGWRREGYRPPPVVALLLPAEGPMKAAAQSLRDGFFAAYFADEGERPEVRVYDTGATPQSAMGAYELAVSEGANRVVGPLAREDVGALFEAHDLRVPVLALNHADTGAPPPSGSQQFGLLPDDEAVLAAEHMYARGYTRVAIVAASDDFAERAALAFRAQFEQAGGTIIGEGRIAANGVDFSAALNTALAGSPIGSDGHFALFVAVRAQQARLLMPQVRIAGGNNLPVFATSHVYSGVRNPGLDRDLDGIEFCDLPWLFDAAPGLPSREDLGTTLPSAAGAGSRLFAFGMDAYRLLPYLDWLQTNRDAYLPGATGQLALDDFGRVRRLLVWATFSNGVARLTGGAAGR